MEFTRKKTKTLVKTEFLCFKQVDFIAKSTERSIYKEGSWSFVERTHQTHAAVIIPYIKETQEIILIKQFRIPFWQCVIEFPAGLIEQGETITTAIHRELLEETGYSGRIIYQSPLLAVSAGLTTEMASYCIVEVDEHSQGEQNLDPLEDIEVLRVKLDAMDDFFKEQLEKQYIIDCKVFLSLGLLKNIKEN